MTNRRVPEWEEERCKKYLRNTYWKFPKFDVKYSKNVHNQGVQNSQGVNLSEKYNNYVYMH